MAKWIKHPTGVLYSEPQGEPGKQFQHVIEKGLTSGYNLGRIHEDLDEPVHQGWFKSLAQAKAAAESGAQGPSPAVPFEYSSRQASLGWAGDDPYADHPEAGVPYWLRKEFVPNPPGYEQAFQRWHDEHVVHGHPERQERAGQNPKAWALGYDEAPPWLDDARKYHPVGFTDRDHAQLNAAASEYSDGERPEHYWTPAGRVPLPREQYQVPEHLRPERRTSSREFEE